MDKAKRKSLIVSYLRDSINMQDFSSQIGMDLTAMSDPLLGVIRSDLSNRASATFMKGEIIAFDKKQEEGLTSLGSDYIEAEKRRLTIQACEYTSLLADSEIRAIIDKWGTSGEITAYETTEQGYKNASFTNLLQFLESHPEYTSEIQEILAEIESENGLSDELKDFSDTINSNNEENNRQNAIREELTSFMDETLHTFDTLLQLDAIDTDTIETIRNASIQSYKIYKDKFSELTAELTDNPTVFVTKLYPTRTGLEKKTELAPALQEKLEQIEDMIEQLEERYGNLSQAVDESPSKTEQGEQQTEAMWQNRFQSWDREAVNLPNSAKRKEEAVKEIQDIQRQEVLQENQAVQEEQDDNGNR